MPLDARCALAWLALALPAAAWADEPSAHPEPSAAEVDAPDLDRGRATYDASCAACHGTTGSGSEALHRTIQIRPRDFANERQMARVSDDELRDVITHGGAGTGRSALMPSWGRVMTDGQIRDVAAYVRTLSEQRPTELVAEARTEPAPTEPPRTQ